MARQNDPDRYLVRRGDTWHYKRRVPAKLVGLNGLDTHIRRSLKTSDLAAARLVRDAHERADNELWASLLAKDGGDVALHRYQAAVRRAEALGLSYRPAETIAAMESFERLADRFEAILDARTPVATSKAALGLVTEPTVTLTQAKRIYVEEIARSELRTKSANQKRKWRAPIDRAVTRFVEIIGRDPAIDDIGNGEARRFFNWWNDRIAPEEGRAEYSASAGNREIGALRKLHGDYFRYMGDHTRPNPFAGFSFSEKRKRSRPAFPVDWIQTRILAPGALDGLNPDARAAMLAVIDLGARPSELCNLDPDKDIHVDAAVPYISITPREDPDDPRELKTDASRRDMPLVGVALIAFRAFPRGFTRYIGKEEALSATVNKYLRENGLTPSPRHTLYSLRHSFEDRMKEAGIDEEMRRIYFGHRRGREAYGEGGSLAWRQRQLRTLAMKGTMKALFFPDGSSPL